MKQAITANFQEISDIFTIASGQILKVATFGWLQNIWEFWGESFLFKDE